MSKSIDYFKLITFLSVASTFVAEMLPYPIVLYQVYERECTITIVQFYNCK